MVKVKGDMSEAREKVLCFGEGNFLRAFCAVVVQRMNENADFHGKMILVQGLEKGNGDLINSQNGEYTVLEKGYQNNAPTEKFLNIDCVSRCVNPYRDYEEFLAIAENPELVFVVSNTTEFGICFDESETAGKSVYKNFPAKLTDFLLRRYRFFQGDPKAGLVILPCELIEKNGQKLKSLIVKYAEYWGAEAGFIQWINQSNVFADTLVDRIVSGFPKTGAESLWKQIGRVDPLLDICEPFFLWVIEADRKKLAHIPLTKSGLNIVITKNILPYRERKVRILNGAHTMSALLGHLAGMETVEQMLKDKDFGAFVETGIRKEIIPSFDCDDLEAYADSVIERFLNPFLNHKLLDIALNSVSKWRTRDLCSLKDYVARYKTLPQALCLSLAGLIAFYKKGVNSFVRDDPGIVSFIAEHDVNEIIKSERLWGEDLNLIAPDFRSLIERDFELIMQNGARAAIREVMDAGA